MSKHKRGYSKVKKDDVPSVMVVGTRRSTRLRDKARAVISTVVMSDEEAEEKTPQAQNKALLDIAEVDMDNEEDYQKLCTTKDGEGNELKDHTGEDLTEDDAPQGDVNQS